MSSGVDVVRENLHSITPKNTYALLKVKQKRKPTHRHISRRIDHRQSLGEGGVCALSSLGPPISIGIQSVSQSVSYSASHHTVSECKYWKICLYWEPATTTTLKDSCTTTRTPNNRPTTRRERKSSIGAEGFRHYEIVDQILERYALPKQCRAQRCVFASAQIRCCVRNFQLEGRDVL